MVRQAGASASGDQGKAESKPAKEEKKESHKAGAHSAKQEPKEKEHKEEHGTSLLARDGLRPPAQPQVAFLVI